jgi:pyruvate/2-oxoglutarate dehydrogenase complex dihydrolipoamide dehydrogenase (E3) component
MGSDLYEVLVVGSGPGGATTAARVAETGKRVLLGDYCVMAGSSGDRSMLSTCCASM